MLDGVVQELPVDLSRFSQKICDRHFGVGADQLLVARRSEKADFCMDIYNADGSRVEMCGNGVRCFAKFVRDLGYSDKTEISVETLGGIVAPKILSGHPGTTSSTSWVQVDMGKPILAENKSQTLKFPSSQVHKLPSSQALRFVTLSMGNPHCVIFVDRVENYPVTEVGPLVEGDPLFPNGTNVEFVEVISPEKLIQRTWERGSGETLACGSGACAALVAAHLKGLVGRRATVCLTGGELEIFWDETTGHVFKTGPAVFVFKGDVVYDNI